MAPDITTDSHTKIPQTVENLNQIAATHNDLEDTIIDVLNEQWDTEDLLGSVQTNIRLTLMISQVDAGEGQIVIEEIQANVILAIGQVHFSRIPNCDSLITGKPPVQINSVYVKPDMRLKGLALLAYQFLSKHFTVVSDTLQTLDGASFWRLKLADLENYHIEIVDQFGTAQAETRQQDNGQPIIYRTENIASNPTINATIWGFEDRQDNQIYTHRYQKVQANYTVHRDHVELVLVPELPF